MYCLALAPFRLRRVSRKKSARKRGRGRLARLRTSSLNFQRIFKLLKPAVFAATRLSSSSTLAAIFLFSSLFLRVCPLWPAASKRQTPPYGKGNFRPVGGNETSRLGNLSRRKRHCSPLPAGILIVHRNATLFLPLTLSPSFSLYLATSVSIPLETRQQRRSRGLLKRRRGVQGE